MKKLISIFIGFVFLCNLTASSLVFAKSYEEKKLVAILVSEDLANLDELKTYAKILGKNLNKSLIKIYKVSEEETQFSIFKKLQKLYFEGVLDGEIFAKLSGILLVDLPLPSVKIEDLEKKSPLPYTDFENPYFYFDEEADLFVKAKNSREAKAEIFHGVIFGESKSFYKNYFKKIENFQNGELKSKEEIFYSDKNLEKTQNQELLKLYEKKKNYLKQIAYQHYTDYFLTELGDFEGLKSSELGNDLYSVFQIEGFLPEASEVGKGFLQKVNDFAFLSDLEGDKVDSGFKLIEIEDEKSLFFLKALNDLAEKKVLERTRKNWQKQIEVDENFGSNEAKDCSKLRGSPNRNDFSKQVKFSSLSSGERTSSEEVLLQTPDYSYCNKGKENKKIDSLIFHNSPNKEDLLLAINSPQITDLPVDQEHFLSFKGNEGKISLELPDLFEAEDLESYLKNYKNYLNEKLTKDGEKPVGEDFFEEVLIKNEAFDEAKNFLNLNLEEKLEKIREKKLVNGEDGGYFLRVENESLKKKELNFFETDFNQIQTQTECLNYSGGDRISNLTCYETELKKESFSSGSFLEKLSSFLSEEKENEEVEEITDLDGSELSLITNKKIDARILEKENLLAAIGKLEISEKEVSEKALLKILSGQSYGEAFLQDFGVFDIFYGDPSLSFARSFEGDFGGEIGESVFSFGEEIDFLEKLDFDKNGLEDLVVVLKNGEVELLKSIGKGEFVRKGKIAHFKEIGKISATKNGLIFLNGEKELVFLQFKDGAVFRNSYEPEIGAEKIFDFEVGDLDFDGSEDLLLSNSREQVLVFYGSNSGFSSEGKLIYGNKENLESSASFGIGIDERKKPPEIILEGKNKKLVQKDGVFSSYCLDCLSEESSETKSFNSDDLKKELREKRSSVKNEDKSFEEKVSDLNKQLKEREREIGKITCLGGSCVNSPINYAFFVPGKINVQSGVSEAISVEAGAVSGSPVFGMGYYPCTSGMCPMPCAGVQCYAANPGIYRVYISPTVTGGVGFAYCSGHQGDPTGQSPTSSCIVSALPVEETGVCENQDLDEVIKLDKNIGKIKKSAENFFGEGFKDGTKEGLSSSYGVGIDGFEIKVFEPGGKTMESFYSGFLTKWADKQVTEISQKLLTMPSVRLVLPDFSSSFETANQELQKSQESLEIFGEELGEKVKEAEVSLENFKKTEGNLEKLEEGLDDFYGKVEEIPFISLEKESVKIKIPRINPEKLENSIQEIEDWLENANKIKENYKNQGKNLEQCLENFSEQDCKNGGVTAEINYDKIIQRLEKELKTLKSYKELPEKITAYRGGLAKMLGGVVKNLNSLLEMFGGWILENKKIIENYVKAYYLATEAIKSIQDLVLVFEEHKNSCEPCRANSYLSNFSLAKMFFSLVPEPPILKFPSWPNFRLDLSDIQMGAKVTVPEIDFQMEEIIFDLDLAQLDAGNLEANLELDLDLVIPSFPQLPDLPKLPEIKKIKIPNLPNLPPPPTLPDFPGYFSEILETVKTILRLYCLIFEKGLFVYQEGMLKQVIEGLTNRSSKVILPIDFKFLQVANPTYSELEEVQVKSQLRLFLESEQLSETLEQVSEKWNQIETNLKRKVEKTESKIENETNEEIEKLNDKVDETLDSLQEEIDKKTQSYLPKEKETKIFAGTFNTSEEESSLRGIFISHGNSFKKFLNYEKELSKTLKPIEVNSQAIFAIGNEVFRKKKFNFEREGEEILIENFSAVSTELEAVKDFEVKKIGEKNLLTWKDEEKFDSYLLEIKSEVDGFDLDKRNGKSLFYLLEKSGAKNTTLKKVLTQRSGTRLEVKEFKISELEIKLNKNFYFAKIRGIQNESIGNLGNKEVIFGSEVTEEIQSEEVVEKFVPVNTDFEVSFEKEGKKIYWDLDGDGVYEQSGTSALVGKIEKIQTLIGNLKLEDKTTGDSEIKKLKITSFVPKLNLNPFAKGKIQGKVNREIENFKINLVVEDQDGNQIIWPEKIQTEKDGSFEIPRSSIKNREVFYDENGNLLNGNVGACVFSKKLEGDLKIWAAVLDSENKVIFKTEEFVNE